MARKPTIVDVSPFNYAVDVNTESSIRAYFDIDLDNRYIQDFVYLLDETGTKVEGRTSYKKKVITFTPSAPLRQGVTYQFVIVGDADLTDKDVTGIRSIIGDAMAGSFTSRFTTEADELLPPPIVKYPIHNTVIRSKPIFEWMDVQGANGYGIEISTTNTFNTKIYPADDETVITGTSLEPMADMEDGTYYWRICTIQSDGTHGVWSKSTQFHLETENRGKVSEEDEDFQDPADDLIFEELSELEFVEAFPKEAEMHVPLNVKNLYFRLLGDIDTTDLDALSFTLTGEHVSEDFEETSHGVVDGRTTIVESLDGTVYLVFTPKTEEDGED